MPKGGVEDYIDNDVSQFVALWNDWSTAKDRQAIYTAAWHEKHDTAVGFVNAMAADKDVKVPYHIEHYLTVHTEFSDIFLKAFKRVKNSNWRLGVVVDQTADGFDPQVAMATDKKAEIVMLYVVGDQNLEVPVS